MPLPRNLRFRRRRRRPQVSFGERIVNFFRVVGSCFQCFRFGRDNVQEISILQDCQRVDHATEPEEDAKDEEVAVVDALESELMFNEELAESSISSRESRDVQSSFSGIDSGMETSHENDRLGWRLPSRLIPSGRRCGPDSQPVIPAINVCKKTRSSQQQSLGSVQNKPSNSASSGGQGDRGNSSIQTTTGPPLPPANKASASRPEPPTGNRYISAAYQQLAAESMRKNPNRQMSVPASTVQKLPSGKGDKVDAVPQNAVKTTPNKPNIRTKASPLKTADTAPLCKGPRFERLEPTMSAKSPERKGNRLCKPFGNKRSGKVAPMPVENELETRDSVQKNSVETKKCVSNFQRPKGDTSAKARPRQELPPLIGRPITRTGNLTANIGPNGNLRATHNSRERTDRYLESILEDGVDPASSRGSQRGQSASGFNEQDMVTGGQPKSSRPNERRPRRNRVSPMTPGDDNQVLGSTVRTPRRSRRGVLQDQGAHGEETLLLGLPNNSGDAAVTYTPSTGNARTRQASSRGLTDTTLGESNSRETHQPQTAGEGREQRDHGFRGTVQLTFQEWLELQEDSVRDGFNGDRDLGL